MQALKATSTHFALDSPSGGEGQLGVKAERLTPRKSSPQVIREQTLLLDACMSLKGQEATS